MITDKMLRDVFGVAGGIGTIPRPDVPFVMPQLMQRVTDGYFGPIPKKGTVSYRT